MSNAILRVLVCLSLLAMGAFAAALPPPGTPPPPPPPPRPVTVAPPVASPPLVRAPTATNPVFWIQCPSSVYLPNNAPTAPAASVSTETVPDSRLAPAANLLVVARYPDAFSPQFAAVLNRVLTGCTMNIFPAVDPRYQYPQAVYSDLQLVEISNGIDPKTQRPTETLRFRYREVLLRQMPANGGLCGNGGTGHATQTASCASGKMCVMPQQNFCL